MSKKKTTTKVEEPKDVTPVVADLELTAEELAEIDVVREAEEAEARAAIEEQKRLEEEAKNPKRSEGSEIASAIREGLAATKEDKRIKISADKSVRSMFAVVRNKKTGEVMLRENATGVLSKVQLRSIEEQEADLQKQEVEVI